MVLLEDSQKHLNHLNHLNHHSHHNPLNHHNHYNPIPNPSYNLLLQPFLLFFLPVPPPLKPLLVQRKLRGTTRHRTVGDLKCALRWRVFLAEMFVCGGCGLVCGELLETLKGTESELERRKEVLRVAPRFADLPKQLASLVAHPVPGKLYQADHVKPVWMGGGQCTLANMQILCAPCHMAKTKKEATERAQLRRFEEEMRRAKGERWGRKGGIKRGRRRIW